MISKSRLLIAASVAGLIHFESACAQSQTPPSAVPQAQDNAGDIIVTARRVEERLQDVPVSITVFNQQQLDARNIFTPGDLASFTPSLSVNNRFGAEKATFIIRGFGQDYGTSPSVGVYFADAVAPRGNGYVISGNGAAVGNLFDLQNVEVLKGPQGTLQGRNTTGGAVMLIPQKPKDTFGGYIEGSVGDYNMQRVQAVINAPLSDTFRVRLGVDEQTRDGYLKNISGTGPSAFGNVNYIAGRLSIVGDLTPNLENYTIASYSQSNTTGPLAKLTICNPASFFGAMACSQIASQRARNAGFWSVDNDDPNPFLHIRQWQVINTTTWKASDSLTIKNIASYGEYRESQSSENDGTNFPFAGTILPVVVFNPGPSGVTGNESTLTEELHFAGSAAQARFTWQAGAYFERSSPIGNSDTYSQILLPCTNLAALQCTDVLGGSGSLSAGFGGSTYTDEALYAQASYKLTKTLSFTTGIRYTHDKQTSSLETLQIKFPTPSNPTRYCSNVLLFNSNPATFAPLNVQSPAQCFEQQSISSGRPTWLVGLDYKPTDDLLIYTKWSRGYRAGGLNLNNFGVEAWEPEKLDDYEVGLKTSFKDRIQGYFDIAGFYDNYTKQQVPVAAIPQPQYIGLGGAQAEVNAGKSRIWGVETDLSIRPFSSLKIDVGYTYLNTKLESLTLPATPPIYSIFTSDAAVGGPLTYSPKNRVTTSLNYTLPISGYFGELVVGGSFTYTGAYNTTSILVTPLYRTAATNYLTLNANWKSMFGQPFDLSFFMTNALNKKYYVAPLSSYPSFGFDGATTNLPRMFGFSLKYRFGKQ